jgi:LytR cell envelope-related transcriptional attenuator
MIRRVMAFLTDRQTVRLSLGALAAVCACRGDAAPAHAVPGDRGPALVVEVLNASAKPGLARVGTRALRRAGIDVVYFGNAPADAGRLDSTRIIVRRGSRDVGERVRGALGVGRVSVELDAGRLLDASVLLGADFVPREHFHP